MQAQMRAGMTRESPNVNRARLDMNSVDRYDVDERSSMLLYISRLNHLPVCQPCWRQRRSHD